MDNITNMGFKEVPPYIDELKELLENAPIVDEPQELKADSREKAKRSSAWVAIVMNPKRGEVKVSGFTTKKLAEESIYSLCMDLPLKERKKLLIFMDEISIHDESEFE